MVFFPLRFDVFSMCYFNFFEQFDVLITLKPEKNNFLKNIAMISLTEVFMKVDIRVVYFLKGKNDCFLMYCFLLSLQFLIK